MEVEDFIQTMKPYTKIYLGLSILCGLIFGLGILKAENFIPYLPGGLWNPISFLVSIIFIPKLGFNVMFQLIFFYFLINQLEQSFLPNRYGDFIMLLFFIILGNYFIVLTYSYYTFVPSMMEPVRFIIIKYAVQMSLTYIFCRKYPNAKIKLFFILEIKAMYYVWIEALFLLMEKPAMYVISGVIIGHLYYFLKDILPLTKRVFLLQTPYFINKLAEQFLILMNEKTERVQNVQQNNGNQFREFVGQGQRIG